MLYFIIIVVTLIWGVNGILDRKALATGHPLEVNFIGTLAMIAVALVYLAIAKWQHIPLAFHRSTVLFAALNGVLVPTAYVIFLYALSRGALTTVVTITAAYPIITYILAVLFLNEPVTPSKLAGIVIVVIGMIVFVK